MIQSFKVIAQFYEYTVCIVTDKHQKGEGQ